MPGMGAYQKLLDFLDKLDASHIYFTLSRHRSEALMVLVEVPGERWEIEFFADAHVEVEVFRADGSIEGEEALDTLFERFAD